MEHYLSVALWIYFIYTTFSVAILSHQCFSVPLENGSHVLGSRIPLSSAAQVYAHFCQQKSVRRPQDREHLTLGLVRHKCAVPAGVGLLFQGATSLSSHSQVGQQGCSKAHCDREQPSDVDKLQKKRRHSIFINKG